jgi:3,5-epimerase/4-reductase
MKVLIFGGKGWIGQQFCDVLTLRGINIVHSQCRADDEFSVEAEILQITPDRVISLIGRTSGPGFTTIDYLEQKGKVRENIKDNLFGPIVLAALCQRYKVHLTYLGTGCIFDGYKINESTGYTESDKPDFFGSSYSVVKGFTDRLMHLYDDSVLNVRIRMPIVANPHPKNFITKIMTYKKICSIPNSMTVLPELIPMAVDMMINGITGTINLTNPGLISHNEILEMVKEIIDPNLVWENFTREEQSKILLADRSNNLLNTNKLKELYPQVLPIKESIRKLLIEMKSHITDANTDADTDANTDAKTDANTDAMFSVQTKP